METISSLGFKYDIEINGAKGYLYCKPFKEEDILDVLDNLQWIYGRFIFAGRIPHLALVQDLRLTFISSPKKMEQELSDESGEPMNLARIERQEKYIDTFLRKLDVEYIKVITAEGSYKFSEIKKQGKAEALKRAWAMCFFLSLMFHYSGEDILNKNANSVLSDMRKSYITSFSIMELRDSLETTFTKEEGAKRV